MERTTLSRSSCSARVPIGRPPLPFELVLPADASGLVLFVHGSGSSWRSPRNQWVATELHRHGIATLLFDLLTESEALDSSHGFDVLLLSDRVEQALQWAAERSELRDLRIGLFGASTGAAAALVAAARRPGPIAAIVSRGGRPDLAAQALPEVQAPTLLIAGSEDPEVLALNRTAMRRLRCAKRLEVVPGATHLFDEPGALECVAELAAVWFERHLARGWKGW